MISFFFNFASAARLMASRAAPHSFEYGPPRLWNRLRSLIPAAVHAERAFMPHLRHPLCRNRAPQADSVIPAAPPTLLHTLLLLDGLLPLEQEAPVDIAIQVPSPGCRRQALGSGLIGAVAGIAELPTHDAPRVII